MKPSNTIFESINARALSAPQVAETFVLSSHFTDLCRRRHSIVLGPRGSGKATLLKMLQPAALEVWKHPKADEIASALDFTAIFVATDISWSAQLSVLGLGSSDPELSKHLALACFNTHALKGVVTAFMQRTATAQQPTQRNVRSVNLAPGVESTIVNEIAKVWRIDGISPSFF